MNNADMPANPTYSSDVLMQEGLTKREYFAGLAMQGMMASKFWGEFSANGMASIALEQADALLKELEK